MSYDLKLFKPRPGEDPLVTAEQEHDDELLVAPPDPEKEALKRRVADALIAFNPELSIYPMDYKEIARFEQTTVEEARLKHRHLELNGAETGNGIQITLFDQEAHITVPLWHRGQQAAKTFRQIQEYLAIITRETGYLVYDPQIASIIDPAQGLHDSLKCYASGVRTLPGTVFAWLRRFFSR